MYSTLKTKIKSLSFLLILLLVYCLNGCATPSTIVVTRAGTALDDGKLYVYLENVPPIGKKQLNENQPIAKGQTRNFQVSNGTYRIWVEVDRIVSDKIQFTADNNSVKFITAVERIGGSVVVLLERSLDEQ
jgi:hypothetical protein